MQYISDINMIKAIDFLKKSKIIKFKKECFDVLGINASNVHKIQFPEKHQNSQANHFTIEQIRILCNTYGVNANYIFGLEENVLQIGNKKSNNPSTSDKISL